MAVTSSITTIEHIYHTLLAILKIPAIIFVRWKYTVSLNYIPAFIRHKTIPCFILIFHKYALFLILQRFKSNYIIYNYIHIDFYFGNRKRWQNKKMCDFLDISRAPYVL